MNDFTYQQSLPLRLIPSYGRHQFIVGESNAEAVNWIDNFQNWSMEGLIIIGPKASGKSHLVSTLKHRINCQIINGEDVNRENFNILNLKDLIVENIEQITNFNFFLNIINILKEKKHKLVLTSRQNINDMDIGLLDLKSRLLTMSQTEILLPTDDVLRGIIIKISNDKGLKLNDIVINFLLNHLERSYSVINRFINKLDELSLIKKKRITIPLVKSLLK